MDIPRSTLPEMDFVNQRVFVRADLNVPLRNGSIIDDHRLASILPTLDLILQKEGKIILATHLGRPQGKPDPALSARLLLPWFIERGYAVRFEPELSHATFQHEPPTDIILLENLRFYPGEKDHDPAFAQTLFNLADIYVNDAFALLHRTDTSITLLPKLFPADKKTIGLLIAQECSNLEKIRNHPKQPFFVIVGGGKVRDKIPLLRAMIGKAQAILLCPAIVFTFLKAQGHDVGSSLVDDTALETVTDILHDAATHNTEMIFPVDYQVAHGSLQGELATVSTNHFPEHAFGITIGPKTEDLFAQKIQQARTIFFNGLPGLWNRPQTLKGAEALLRAMADSNAYTVIGGGDSVALADQLTIADRISYCSTGGGATLAYIAGEELPGLKALGY